MDIGFTFDKVNIWDTALDGEKQERIIIIEKYVCYVKLNNFMCITRVNVYMYIMLKILTFKYIYFF